MVRRTPTTPAAPARQAESPQDFPTVVGRLARRPARQAGSPQDATKALPACLCPSEDRNAAKALRLAAALAWAELQQHPGDEPAAAVALVIGEGDWARLGGAPEPAAVLDAMGNPTRPPEIGVSAWKVKDDNAIFPAGSTVTCDSARAIVPGDAVVCEIAGVGLCCVRWHPRAGRGHTLVEMLCGDGRKFAIPRDMVRWMIRAVEVQAPLRAV